MVEGCDSAAWVKHWPNHIRPVIVHPWTCATRRSWTLIYHPTKGAAAMADHISIRKVTGTWVVRTGGAVLAETTDAMELTEGTRAPVIYFPRGDIGMTFLDPSETTTHCPHKGDTTYFSIAAEGGTIKDAAWSYEDPKAGVDRIKGYIAFDGEKVTVEEL